MAEAEPAAGHLRVVQSIDPSIPVGLQVSVPSGGGVIGRTPDVPICFAGSTVSRRHASFTRSEEGWMLQPLTQTNATFVSGESVTEATVVPDGVPFQVGGVVCVFVADPGTTPVLEPLGAAPLLEIHDDGGACTVFAGAQLLPIAPAPARLLAALVAHEGKPVHRWDLLETLGEAANLDKCVSLLRRGLREAMETGPLDAAAVGRALTVDSEDPATLSRALVVTRRGHGYLFALPPRLIRLVES